MIKSKAKSFIVFIYSSIFIFTCFFSSILTFGISAIAADAFDYSEIAKNKSYVGGSEESDLKILPETYFQKNKKINNIEESNEGF